ncbi:MAG: 5'-methylthioadenosine/adenosylhomocysteine nucleosidase [Lachnospiraceae bacterium]|nr:5'-methylthioadenosine/adenosylhomocysteine nucleosidase [Lachnospiraceae bacterium]
MIGIIGAMQEEVEKLIEILEDKKETTIANMTYYQGKYANKDVVVVKCGIGKINAAICTQILIDTFKPDYIFNTGIAGGLATEVDIEDIVVSTDVVHHDMDAVAFGYPLGQIPRMEVFSFKADEELVELVLSSAVSAGLLVKCHKGRVATGDQFIATKEKKEFIIKEFNAACAEMEGAAIAQTAYVNGVPFVIIRAISDKADDSASMDYPVFERNAINNVSMLTKEVIRRIM